MKSMNILKAIGGTDDELLNAYEQDSGEKQNKHIWVRRVSVAACLCLVAAAVLVLPRFMNPVRDSAGQSTTPYSQEQGDEPKENDAVIIDGSKYHGDSAACYASPKPGTTQFFVEVYAAMDEYRGTDARLFLAIDIFTKDGLLATDSDDFTAEAARLSSLGYEVGWCGAWNYVGKGEIVPDSFFYGLFTVEELESFATDSGYGYAFHFRYNGDGSAVEYSGADKTVIVEAESSIKA